jgi:putative transcriptional regulator
LDEAVAHGELVELELQTMPTKTPKPESDILATVHESVAGLRKAGLVDQATMRNFDALCLTTVEPLSPAEIRALREREQVSQAVFSRYLNVRKDAVSKWERGEKRPDGPSLKLLNLVRTKGLQSIA